MEILNTNTELGMFLHVVIASALAGVIGIEREMSQKPAGFRTHLIIGGSAALLIMLGKELVRSYQDSPFLDAIRTDPLRIMEAIIVGISFIGAGTILKLQESSAVRYLTTAAATLFSAAIGITVALQLYYLAIGLSIFTLVITFLLGRVEQFINKSKKGEEQ